MKRSLVISFVLHCLILGSAMLVLGAPAPLEVADVDALPVTLVPVEDVTQIQQGDDKADLAEIAAPVPTKRPTEVADAENVGDNDVDLSTQKDAAPSTREEKQAAIPKPAEAPEPQPAPEPEPVAETPAPAPVEEPPPPAPTPAPKPAPAPAPEPAPAPTPEAVETPAPAPAPAPEPQTAEAEPEQPAEEETTELAFPDQAPLPTRRPPEPQRQVAETKPAPQKPAEKKPETDNQTTASTTPEKDDFNVDDIAALLNRTEAEGGGARRSEAPAALGGQRTTAGSTLSQSEIDALRGQIQRNWSILAGLDGADGVRIRIHMKLDPSGAIIGEPEVTATGGSDSARRILAGGARRAVLKASPFTQLPPEKYDAWSEVIVNFDPSQMI
ncbi:hypothetical protein [Martelella endophytica]|uniref:Signal peptide protein n=1 Tax=Martelella endophytica TaxID=1486262 RepID=A0A0D5LSK2_MAREN|nr:hypothetical protein [Martelella endophytica]AJY47184.1 signal peptide protein [Martelella endophytica]